MRLTSLRMTCEACPSQWEGQLADGRRLYARYRWGVLSVGIGETDLLAVRASVSWGAQPHLYQRLGDPLDGTLNTDTLVNCLRDSGIEVAA